MPFSRTRPIVASLALSLLCAAESFAQAPAAPMKGGAAPPAHSPTASVTTPPPGYHWHTLVLQHAVPSDILQMMHWDSAAAHPAALPAGVLRIFALQSNNSLLLQATDDGYAKVAGIVSRWDVAARDVRIDMVLVVVPEARAGSYTPDMPASRLLPLLLADGARTVSVPTVTMPNGVTESFSITYTPPWPTGRMRLIQAGKTEVAFPFQVLMTPQINADGTVTLGLTLMPGLAALSAPMPPVEARTARAGESVVYDVLGPVGARGERVFLFAKPTITDSTATMTDSVTVTP